MEPCQFTQRLQKKLINEIADDLRRQGIDRAIGFKRSLDKMLKQPEVKWFSAEGVATELAVNIETVRRWIRSGQLKAVKAGRQYRIRPDDIQDFLDRSNEETQP